MHKIEGSSWCFNKETLASAENDADMAMENSRRGAVSTFTPGGKKMCWK